LDLKIREEREEDIILLASIISHYEICIMMQLFYRIVSKISRNHDFIPLGKQNYLHIKHYILRNYASDEYILTVKTMIAAGVDITACEAISQVQKI